MELKIILVMFMFVSLSLFVGLASAQEIIILTTENSSAEVTIEGENYTIELVNATNLSATIGVTDSSGNNEVEEIDEGDTKEVNGLDITVVSIDETDTGFEVELSIVAADDDNGDDDNDNDKVKICHIPPGNPGRAHTIEIGVPAFNAHLAHGDFEGECGDDGNKTEIEERIKIVGPDGLEREVRIKRIIRSDGTIERRFRYREKDVLGIEIEEVVDDSDFRRRILRAKLSNGRFADINVLPAEAAERALKRLRLKFCLEENGCEIRLKEIVRSSGDTGAVYELKTKRRARFLAFIPVTMTVSAEVDVESGEIVDVDKPGWAFLATEPEE